MSMKQKFPFVLLGVGIGIIITNTVYCLNPIVEYKEYTQEEIIEKAKDLGMVFVKESIDVDNQSKEDYEEKSKEISFVIEQGDNLKEISYNLLEKGIIDDAEDFRNYAKEKGVSRKFRVGTYSLNYHMDYDEIINILTKENK